VFEGRGLDPAPPFDDQPAVQGDVRGGPAEGRQADQGESSPTPTAPG
jgi:hypothetical protein